MIDKVGGLSLYDNTAKVVNHAVDSKSSGADFGNMITESLGNTRNTLQTTELVSNASLVNEVGLEELAGAVNNAEVTLRTVVAVRDRMINAYQDIIKMPI